MELYQIAACSFTWCGHEGLSNTTGLIESFFEVRSSFEPKTQKKHHGVQDQGEQNKCTENILKEIFAMMHHK